jgi:hypothetical protein
MCAIHFRFEVIDSAALDLFRACEESLRLFGTAEVVEKSTGKAGGKSVADGFLEVMGASGTSTRYVCEARRQVYPELLGGIIASLKGRACELAVKPLLISEYVSPRVADELRAMGVAYLDAAGNAMLIDPPLLVWFRGFKPDRAQSRVASGFQTGGLRLIGFLLKKPDAVNWPLRRLAMEAQSSLGSASRILRDLRRLGFINLASAKRNVLINRAKLLEQWEFGYWSRLRAKLKPRTYRVADALPIEQVAQRLPAALSDDILIGGEVAASLAIAHLRPGTLTLHVHPGRPLSPILKELRLVPDSGGNVTIMELLDATGTWRWEGVAPANLAHPLLVHAELLHGRADDRLREMARLIHRGYLQLNDEPATEQSGT